MTTSHHKIPSTLKLSMLKQIGYGWDDQQIIDWLARQGVFVSKKNINRNYRNNPIYQERIQKFRAQFEAEVKKSPLRSKRHLLSILHEALEDGLASKDYRTVAAIVKQVRELMGFYASPAYLDA